MSKNIVETIDRIIAEIAGGKRTQEAQAVAAADEAPERCKELTVLYQDRLHVAFEEEMRKTGGSAASREVSAMIVAVASVAASLHMEVEYLAGRVDALELEELELGR